jgi:hypothetical protein
VGEHFAYRPDLGRSHEVIFGFGNIFGDLDGVFADDAERIGQLFTAINNHDSPRFAEFAPGRRAAEFDALPPAEVTVGREKARSVEGGLDGPAQQGLHTGVTSGGGVYSVSA